MFQTFEEEHCHGTSVRVDAMRSLPCNAQPSCDLVRVAEASCFRIGLDRTAVERKVEKRAWLEEALYG